MHNTVYDYLMQTSFNVNNGFTGDDRYDYGDTTGWGGAYFYTLQMVNKATDKDRQIANLLLDREKHLIDDLESSGGVMGYMMDPAKTLDLAETFIGIIGPYMGGECLRGQLFCTIIEQYYDQFKILLSPSMIQGIETMNLPYYGPTTIVGGMAGLLLQYPITFSKGEKKDEIYQCAVNTINTLDELVYDSVKNNYCYWNNTDHDFLYVYSTCSTLLGLFRLYYISKDSQYLNKSLRILEGLQGLYSEKYQSYFAAENDDKYFDIYDELGQSHYKEEYIPLSGSNYLTYCYLMAFELTQDFHYLEYAALLLDFIQNNLYDGHQRVEHHLEFGQVSDPSHYCSGCNVQLLYNILLYNLAKQGYSIMEWND